MPLTIQVEGINVYGTTVFMTKKKRMVKTLGLTANRAKRKYFEF